MIKSKRVWEASDGKTFENEADARAHDSLFRNMSKVKGVILNSAGQAASVSVSNLALDLVNKPAVTKQLRDALNSVLEHHRRYGKLVKV